MFVLISWSMSRESSNPNKNKAGGEILAFAYIFFLPFLINTNVEQMHDQLRVKVGLKAGFSLSYPASGFPLKRDLCDIETVTFIWLFSSWLLPQKDKRSGNLFNEIQSVRWFEMLPLGISQPVDWILEPPRGAYMTFNYTSIHLYQLWETVGTRH